MRRYPDQPSLVSIDVLDLENYILAFLKEELPQCDTNEWFLRSVHGANVAGKLANELIEEFL